MGALYAVLRDERRDEGQPNGRTHISAPYHSDTLCGLEGRELDLVGWLGPTPRNCPADWCRSCHDALIAKRPPPTPVW